ITLLLLIASGSTIRFFTDPVVYKTSIEIEDTVAQTITSIDVYYAEFNCEIPYQELHYQSTEDIIYANAIIPFRIVDTERPDSLVDTLYRQFTIPSFSTAAKEQATFLVQFGTYLNEGRFQYRVEILSGEKIGVSESTLEIRSEDYTMSDICLSSDITVDTTGEDLRKGDLRVVPHPSRSFDGRFRNLFFYYELYDIVPGHDTLTAVYTITDPEGRTLRRVSRTVDKIYPAQAVNCGIDIQGIPSGEYDLTVAVEDKEANILAQKGVPFSISRVQRQEVSYQGMPFYDEIEYFLAPGDYRKFKDLPKEGQEAFLVRFWRIHDYPTIAARFEYADEHFYIGDTPGYRTDRGRIYVRYGEPEEIEHPLPLQQQESRPYEHWHYANGEQFIFVDIRGTNEYVLVWTNAVDERSQPTLYKYLPAEKLELLQ
ncbi:MAG: GWxTD domain-containing protein, partial [candidate division WOR-3 bacterium]